MDLYDITYLDKVSKALRIREVPRFLLREGYRLRREIKKNKEFLEKNLENENKVKMDDNNENDEKKIDENDIYSDKEEDDTEIRKENYSINNISKEIENNLKKPFER